MTRDESAIRFIVEQAQLGSTAAFRELINLHSRFAYNIALRVVRNQWEAEEVVQDAFLRIYKYLKSYKGQSKFSTWVYKIVYHVALAQIDQRNSILGEALNIDGNENHSFKLPEELEGYRQIIDEERKEIIKIVLDDLPVNDRIVLTLHYINEQSLEEVCGILSINLSAAKNRLMRARGRFLIKLKEYLKEDLKDII